MVAYESVKTKEKSSWVISKVVAVAYERFSSKRLNHSSNGVAEGGRNQELVAHESSRKESFDCNDVILRAESGKKTHYYKLSKINTMQDRDEAAELFWSLSSADC